MAPLPVDALGELLSGFERLFQTGEFSDLTVFSSARKYAVHSAVVCPQSPFFWAACTRNLKEQTTREIHLREDNAEAVDCMIRYFYARAYPEDVQIEETVLPTTSEAAPSSSVGEDDGPKLGNDTTRGGQEAGVAIGNRPDATGTEDKRDLLFSNLQRDLLVYAMAQKYGIADLQQKAACHFDKELQRMELSPDIIDVVRDVYSTTPSHDRGLRDIIVTRVYSEIQRWVKEAEFMKALAGEGEFCADLLSCTVQKDLEQYEAALTAIEHPGLCETCQATLVTSRFVSKRGNVNIKKYCAKCSPWGWR